MHPNLLLMITAAAPYVAVVPQKSLSTPATLADRLPEKTAGEENRPGHLSLILFLFAGYQG
jgi:hypothetical protein